MKKLFLSRSSASSSRNDQLTGYEVYWENKLYNGGNEEATEKARNTFHNPRGLFKPQKEVLESQNYGSNLCLSKSLPIGSAALHEGHNSNNLSCLDDQNRYFCSSSDIPRKRSNHLSSRSLRVTSERHSKTKFFEAAFEKPSYLSSSIDHYYDSWDSSSHCSSNISKKVVDCYAHGVQEQDGIAPKRNYSHKNHTEKGKGKGKSKGVGNHSPRVHTTYASPNDGMKDEPRFRLVRETESSQLYSPSGDWAESGFGHESPRRLAKHMVETLPQSHDLPETSLREFDDHDIPFTLEHFYGDSFSSRQSLHEDSVSQKGFPLYGTNETTNTETNEKLLRKSKEAEERVLLLSEEFVRGEFLEDNRFSVLAMVQKIATLTKERVRIANEVSSALQSPIADRASAREELASRTQRLENEKNELQLALEKELDSRLSEWPFKLEKYQEEEHMLHERVRELEEQNVSLQMVVSSLSDRKMVSRSRSARSEMQLALSTKMDEVSEENQCLEHNITELEEKHRSAEEDRDCIHRNYMEKERKCKELHRDITRLLSSSNEREETICGLQGGLVEEVEKKSVHSQLGKLLMEQIRLTGVEQGLRKDVEDYRREVDSLRSENINLLDSPKVSEKEGGFSTFKLDQELLTFVCCMQNQGLSLLNDSSQLCVKLLEFVKVKGVDSITNGLDGQFLVESDVKVQALKWGIESLTRSLQTISAALDEKSNIGECHARCLEDESAQLLYQISQDTLRSELKAETLLTSLLREKLYSKDIEVKQLQAELATAVRGNDLLRCEVENAMTNISCMTNKMKGLELQIIQKDENINQLHNGLEESAKELAIAKAILPEISEDRDMLREEVKQSSERNMLLNSEVNALKKKIEALNEDVLLKEGQITILKDTLGKPVDLLSSPDFFDFDWKSCLE